MLLVAHTPRGACLVANCRRCLRIHRTISISAWQTEQTICTRRRGHGAATWAVRWEGRNCDLSLRHVGCMPNEVARLRAEEAQKRRKLFEKDEEEDDAEEEEEAEPQTVAPCQRV